MEKGKRIRLIFKDDDILSETQKLEGLRRSWVLFKPNQHDAVSDLASHLLRAFQLHQSCPHGIFLSKSGFVLPPFESTHILKDNEIISVRKREAVLSIEGKDATDEARKLKALGKQPVNGGVLLLTNEEFRKEIVSYESDEPEEKSEEDGEIPLEVVGTSSANANKRNRKRKAAESLPCYKDKKQRSEAKQSGKTSDDVRKEKKDGSVAEANAENIDEPAKHKHSENNNVPRAGVKRTGDVQENDKEIDDAKISPKETKRVPSRSARRTYAKRRLLKELAKIQKQNATCESEGLQNWKEDKVKADRKKSGVQMKGQKKWKNTHADDESNKADDQPKGLLHLKLSSNPLIKGKKRKHRQNSDFLELPNRNSDVHKQQNQNGELTQMVDTPEQPNHNLDEELGKSSAAVQEHTDQNCDTTNQSNYGTAEENEVLPIEIRPGHIRFEPLDEEEEAMQQHQAPQQNFNWNGITSKKKGQQWGKENHRFTARNDYKSNKRDSETPTKEKERHPEVIDFDKLPLLPGIPKKGDLIAYRVLELSSTWTPEMSPYRVGKVSCYNTESNQTILLPVPEYPLVPEKEDDGDAEAPQLDNSLYKEDGSLEIDFSSLIDVRILTNGRSEPGNKSVTCLNEASTSNVNALKTAGEPSPDVVESKQSKETEPPPAEIGGSIWEQLSESIKAKKEQLAKENGWESTPKKVVVNQNVKKLPESDKKSQKPQPLEDNIAGSGSRSWSYKSLRGSGLGPTMAWLRSKKDT